MICKYPAFWRDLKPDSEIEALFEIHIGSSLRALAHSIKKAEKFGINDLHPVKSGQDRN